MDDQSFKTGLINSPLIHSKLNLGVLNVVNKPVRINPYFPSPEPEPVQTSSPFTNTVFFTCHNENINNVILE